MFGIGEKTVDQSPEELAGFWTDAFGVSIDPELLQEIDSWKIDRHGNFILRMQGGKKLFVGDKKVGQDGELRPVVQKQGGGIRFDARDAYHMMLAHRSLGHTTISLYTGTKNKKALMWAAANLLGINVDGYRPDGRALEYLDQMRSIQRRRQEK